MLKPNHLLIAALATGLVACGESSTLQVSDGIGPSPKLPEPNKTLMPTVNIAEAVGWPDGAKPTPAPGLQVMAFAEGLDHPRWLYVLPNGDVLVAETNAPPKPDDTQGIRGWVMKKVMDRAGAGVPSPNRITLLRDANHDGVAETRTIFLENLNSPFGMTLVGTDLYVADTDRLIRFPYKEGETQIKTQPTKVVDLPGGTLNHHWTKNVIASRDGSFTSPPARTATSRKMAWKRKKVVRPSGRWIGLPAVTASSPQACATPTAWHGSLAAAHCGRRSTNGTRLAVTWCRTTSPQ
jgi:glucose/arabinose dehydrogenase